MDERALNSDMESARSGPGVYDKRRRSGSARCRTRTRHGQLRCYGLLVRVAILEEG